MSDPRRFLMYAMIAVTAGLVMVSCATPQKMLQRGQYDQAIEAAADRLMKRPADTKQLNVLREAYETANMFDLERIRFLEMEGLDDSWVEVYLLYEQLNRRQQVVRRLPSQIRNQFTFVDYNERIIESKAIAADVSYRRGLEYLELDGKYNARRAWEEFERAMAIYPRYEDAPRYQQIAESRGRNHVLFQVENRSGMVIPEYVDAELARIALEDLSTRWLAFHVFENESIEYDYVAVLKLTEIAFTPERISSRTTSKTGEIQDGLRYLLDANGNVQKDSLGNDIQVPNMVMVAAEYTETRQFKSAFVHGSLDFYDMRSEQLIKTEPMSVESAFEHFFGTFTGDRRALGEEQLRIAGGSQVAFPPNEVMLVDATDLLKSRSRAVLRANRRILEH